MLVVVVLKTAVAIYKVVVEVASPIYGFISMVIALFVGFH